MKNTLLIFFSLLLLSLYVSGQCNDRDYLKHKIRVVLDKSNVKIGKNKTLEISNKKLVNTFSSFGVELIKQAFPYSHNAYLKQVYNIRFSGNLHNFKKDLEDKHPNEIRRVLKIPKSNFVKLNVGYNPSDQMWQEQRDLLWHLTKIEADYAWLFTKGSENTKIAMLDTWFDIDHPDLSQKINPNYDPYDNTVFSSNCLKNHHGTGVASMAAAHTDGGGDLASIGFDCRIIGYQAWDGNYLERAHHASLNLNVDVLTSSAGGWRCGGEIDTIEQIAVKEILDNGTIIVMPAGNGIRINPSGDTTYFTRCRPSGSEMDRPWYPLSPIYDDRIIIVTSTDHEDTHIFTYPDGTKDIHSHYPEVDVCAPGYDLAIATSTKLEENGECIDNTDPYQRGGADGTSYATPIVAGTCALMKTVNSSITPSQAQEIIKMTSDSIYDNDLFPGMLGSGRINAAAAVYRAHPVELTGVISGTYDQYFINVSDAVVQNGSSVTLTGSDIVINGTFKVEKGAEFKTHTFSW